MNTPAVPAVQSTQPAVRNRKAAFQIVCDLWRKPDEHRDATAWMPFNMAAPYDGDVDLSGSVRIAMVDASEHPFGYASFDDDGNLYALGTATGVNGGSHADSYHHLDSGAVHTFFWHRGTGEWFGEIFC